jgi:hypothetical protein
LLPLCSSIIFPSLIHSNLVRDNLSIVPDAFIPVQWVFNVIKNCFVFFIRLCFVQFCSVSVCAHILFEAN